MMVIREARGSSGWQPKSSPSNPSYGEIVDYIWDRVLRLIKSVSGSTLWLVVGGYILIMSTTRKDIRDRTLHKLITQRPCHDDVMILERFPHYWSHKSNSSMDSLH